MYMCRQFFFYVHRYHGLIFFPLLFQWWPRFQRALVGCGSDSPPVRGGSGDVGLPALRWVSTSHWGRRGQRVDWCRQCRFVFNIHLRGLISKCAKFTFVASEERKNPLFCAILYVRLWKTKIELLTFPISSCYLDHKCVQRWVLKTIDDVKNSIWMENGFSSFIFSLRKSMSLICL